MGRVDQEQPAATQPPTIDTIWARLIRARKAVGQTIARTATNPLYRSRYVELDAVEAVAGPALLAEGLAIVYRVEMVDGVPCLALRLVADYGAAEDMGRVPLMVDQPGMQALGAAITYARRYGLLAVMALAPEDDDGQACEAPAGQQPVAAPPAARRAAMPPPRAAAPAAQRGAAAPATARAMTSRLAGRCTGCGGSIAVGEAILYSRDPRGAWHARCPGDEPGASEPDDLPEWVGGER